MLGLCFYQPNGFDDRSGRFVLRSDGDIVPVGARRLDGMAIDTAGAAGDEVGGWKKRFQVANLIEAFVRYVCDLALEPISVVQYSTSRISGILVKKCFR